MMRSDIDPDVFLPEVFQICDELSDLVEAVSDERLMTIILILDALPEDMHSIIKMQSIRDPKLGLEEIVAWCKRYLLTIRRGRQFPKGVMILIVEVVIIAVVRQQ